MGNNNYKKGMSDASVLAGKKLDEINKGQQVVQKNIKKGINDLKKDFNNMTDNMDDIVGVMQDNEVEKTYGISESVEINDILVEHERRIVISVLNTLAELDDPNEDQQKFIRVISLYLNEPSWTKTIELDKLGEIEGKESSTAMFRIIAEYLFLKDNNFEWMNDDGLNDQVLDYINLGRKAKKNQIEEINQLIKSHGIQGLYLEYKLIKGSNTSKLLDVSKFIGAYADELISNYEDIYKEFGLRFQKIRPWSDIKYAEGWNPNEIVIVQDAENGLIDIVKHNPVTIEVLDEEVINESRKIKKEEEIKLDTERRNKEVEEIFHEKTQSNIKLKNKMINNIPSDEEVISYVKRMNDIYREYSYIQFSDFIIKLKVFLEGNSAKDGGGILGATAAGAAAGSIIPIGGTLLGGLAGAAIGLVGGAVVNNKSDNKKKLFIQAYSSFIDENARNIVTASEFQDKLNKMSIESLIEIYSGKQNKA